MLQRKEYFFDQIALHSFPTMRSTALPDWPTVHEQLAPLLGIQLKVRSGNAPEADLGFGVSSNM